MNQLDLHGVRYHEVPFIVEDFILKEELPVVVITGQSTPMQNIVREVAAKYKLFCSYESHWNLGALIITEGSIDNL